VRFGKDGGKVVAYGFSKAKDAAADPAMQALAVAPSVEGNLTRLSNGAYGFICRRSDDGSPRLASVTSL